MRTHELDYFIEVSAKSGAKIKDLVAYISKSLFVQNQKRLEEYQDDSDNGSVSSFKSNGDDQERDRGDSNNKTPTNSKTKGQRLKLDETGNGESGQGGGCAC